MDFAYFWLKCFCEGFKFSFETFGALDGGCVVITAILYWTREHHQKFWEEKGEPFVKKWAFPIVALQFVFGVFFVAPYTQYHSEKTLKESAQKSLEDKSPKLDGFIHRSLITEEPGTTNTLIFIDVNVSNSGHDSSPADQYEFRPDSSKNSSTNCETLNFPDEYKLNFFINGKSWQLDLKRTQLISEKTVKTISNGESPRGWLAFRARGMTPGQLQQTNFVISFFDINGNLISVTNGFWKGRHAKFTQSSLEDLTADIPGAEKIFYPVEPPARTNWMPPELPQGCSNIVVFFGAMPQFLSRQMAEAADTHLTEI